MRSRIARSVFVLGIFLLAAPSLPAQAPAGKAPSAKEGTQQDRGFTLHESFEGSSNNEGQVMDFTSTAGYIFSKHFSVDSSVPIYFVRSTSTTTAGARTTTTSSGIGDVSTALHFTFRNPIVNYSSSLTGAAPSGDTSRGRSTGRATFDWTNSFSREFGRVTPFANLGAGNTLFSTRAFKRPFLTLGKVAHFEAGASLDLGHSLSFSASAYDVAPWGQQKVFSRIVTRRSGSPGGPSRNGRVFENNALTTGGADLVRDNGFNAAFDFSPSKFLDLEFGYSRSVHFRLDTISFGVGINLTPLFRGAGRF